MAKVEMKIQITGTRDGVDWPAPGKTIDVPADEADDLVRAGVAKKATAGTAKKAAAGDDS